MYEVVLSISAVPAVDAPVNVKLGNAVSLLCAHTCHGADEGQRSCVMRAHHMARWHDASFHFNSGDHDIIHIVTHFEL